MSRETIEHLNQNTLIGFTDKRGMAWHYRADAQGAEPNHYPLAVPIADVRRRLFHWEALSRPVSVSLPATLDTADGVDADGAFVRSQVIDGKQAIVRSDTGHVMGIFAEGYSIHQYDEWLLGTVGTILDDQLSIGSAGLLKGGAVAWVSVEVPDTITTPEGVTFRPNLLACTSMDGSLATTFKRVVTNTVCDNTMAAALGEAGQVYKVKHSRYSKAKITQAREALAVVHTIADDFAAEVAALCAVTVTPQDWKKFLEAFAPIDPLETKGRSLTMAENKRETLNKLYRWDERVSPWAGTAYGVLQAVNTYTHHEGIVRNADRAERNMLRAVTGGVDKLDTETLATLNKVLETV